MVETMLTYALQYARQGFTVLPLQGKIPFKGTHGLKDATQLQITIKEYWAKWPDANIGILTDGLAVIDFDAKSGGLASKEKIIEKYGPLPLTRVHKTGGGGEHWIYRQPNGTSIRNTTKVLGFPGVDLRGTGGYIVVPPSIHESGKYYEVISEGPIVECPEWLLMANRSIGYVLRRGTGDRGYGGKGEVGEPGQPIPQSTRNDTMIRNAGAMRRRGMTEEEILAALLVQNKRCDPPLDEKEVQKIAHSGARYEPDILESLPGTPDPLGIEQVENIEQVERLSLSVEQSGTSCTKLNKVEQFQQSEMPKRDKIIWKLADEWLTYHRGERFDLDTICRHLVLTTRGDRQSVAKKLWREVKTGTIEKTGRLYSFIDKTFTSIDWVNAPPSIVVPIVWPIGRGDEGEPSKFGFDGHVTISSGDVIVIAGVTNMGKSTFCLNVLWDNMDTMPCTLMGNEYVAGKFKNRIVPMTWADPLNENGTPKFELIKRLEGWKDIIRPDNLNIIDWINLGDNFYQMGTLIEGMQSKLRNGVLLASIQKDTAKSLGLGGGFSQHLASLYLTIDFERLTVVKAKEWQYPNPNGKVYGFRIVEAGTKFADIRELERCRRCWGTGKLKQGQCDDCEGKGWIDAYHNY